MSIRSLKCCRHEHKATFSARRLHRRCRRRRRRQRRRRQRRRRQSRSDCQSESRASNSGALKDTKVERDRDGVDVDVRDVFCDANFFIPPKNQFLQVREREGRRLKRINWLICGSHVTWVGLEKCSMMKRGRI